MAKDPAFLFYYDRFLSGTISMTDSEVGQYIRLMCIQANKGYVTEKDLLHISKTLVNDVTLKFAPIGAGIFANSILTEILIERKTFTESRRNNRKGKKKEQVNNTSDNTSNTSVKLVVSVDKDKGIEYLLKSALDEIFIERVRMQYKHKNFDSELDAFKVKVRGSPEEYQTREASGIRNALIYHMNNAKDKVNDRKTSKSAIESAQQFSGNY